MRNAPLHRFQDFAKASVDAVEELRRSVTNDSLKTALNMMQKSSKNAGARRNQIEPVYRAAFDIALEQEAKLLQLRTATSMSRLLKDPGEPVAAREVIALPATCNLPDVTFAEPIWRISSPAASC